MRPRICSGRHGHVLPLFAPLAVFALALFICLVGCAPEPAAPPVKAPSAENAPQAATQPPSAQAEDAQPKAPPQSEPAGASGKPDASQEKSEPGKAAVPAKPDLRFGLEMADVEKSEPGKAAVPAGAVRVMVPMRDGTQLETDYYLPEKKPAPIVLARSVYPKDAAAALAPVFKAFGMGMCVQDTRGRGGSQGEDRLFADDGWGTNQDAADTVNWLARQEWCNGTIGGFGMSALGITQVLMAPVCPSLKCQAIWVAASNFYGQVSYQGGVFHKQLIEEWTKAQGNYPMLETWRAHPAYDSFWQLYNAEARTSDVHAPAIHVGGWWDIFGQGTLNNFTSRQHQGGEGAKGNQMLVMGAWHHGGPMGPTMGELKMDADYVFDINTVSVRFLQHWLTGTQNGIMDEPAVRYYTVGDTSDPAAPGNEWRDADDWPPFPTEDVSFYLYQDGLLRRAQPAADEGKRTFAYDPANPVPTRGGANLVPDFGIGPMDQHALAARDDTLTFATDPLDEPFEITGPVRVKLYVSSDAPDTDFTAKLLDIYPDGREMLMLDGIQRAKFRKGFEKPDPLPPGQVGEVAIDLWSISLIVNKGHRIGVHISSSNYPRFEVNPNTGADFPPPGFTPKVEPPVTPGGEPPKAPDGAAGEPAAGQTQPYDPGAVRVAHNTVYMDKARPSALIVPARPKAAGAPTR